jgi:hypothetical protein
MTTETRDEDENTNPRLRRMLVKCTAPVVAVVAILSLYGMVRGHGALDNLVGILGFTPSQSAHMGIFIPLALLVFVTAVRISSNELDLWSGESDTDSFHRRYNLSSMMQLAFAGMWMNHFVIDKSTPGEAVPLDSIIFVVLFFLLMAAEIAFGPFSYNAGAREAIEDEFYRAMRAKAIRVGFAMVTTAGTAALLLFRLLPGNEAGYLCSALYAGFATTYLYYNYLIWRGDRGC